MSEPKWGATVCGIMFILLAGFLLWDGRRGLLYHIPIYPRGPLSWMDPWQAIVAGSLCFVLGAYITVIATRRR